MSLNTSRIRRIQLTDIEDLLKIGRATFAETFVDDCSPEDMELFLEQQHNYNLIKSELQNPESKFFFAESEGEIMAYLKINVGKAQTETKLDNAFEVERIYVLEKYQGKKIGKLLLDFALKMAKTDKYSWVWLGVWEYNKKAIQFYEKNGFVKFDSHSFMVGTDKQTDILMKLDLAD